MIENARGMIEIESIAKSGKGYLDGLLVSISLPVLEFSFSRLGHMY